MDGASGATNSAAAAREAASSTRISLVQRNGTACGIHWWRGNNQTAPFIISARRAALFPNGGHRQPDPRLAVAVKVAR